VLSRKKAFTHDSSESDDDANGDVAGSIEDARSNVAAEEGDVNRNLKQGENFSIFANLRIRAVCRKNPPLVSNKKKNFLYVAGRLGLFYTKRYENVLWLRDFFINDFATSQMHEPHYVKHELQFLKCVIMFSRIWCKRNDSMLDKFSSNLSDTEVRNRSCFLLSSEVNFPSFFPAELTRLQRYVTACDFAYMF